MEIRVFVQRNLFGPLLCVINSLAVPCIVVVCLLQASDEGVIIDWRTGSDNPSQICLCTPSILL